MFCISISYQKTPLQVRQQFAISAEEQITALQRLTYRREISGGVIVSTCNRSEVYFSGDKAHMEAVGQLLADLKHFDVETFKTYGMFYGGTQAVQHLFRVVCGLDSMVLGEDEILHQVKEGYLRSFDLGYTNSELNILFQGAFNCAKQTKSTTRLSTTPVSVGTLTANTIERYLQVKCGKQNEDCTVLVIGATGKIGSIVVKDLAAKGIGTCGTVRHHCSNTASLTNCCSRFVRFEDRYTAMKQVDAVVSATTSPHYTITQRSYLAHAVDSRPRLLIDLAVPYDIDQALGRVAGVTLLDIDCFQQLSQENRSIKQDELQKAEQILSDCVEDTLKKLNIRDFWAKHDRRQVQPWFAQMVGYLHNVLDSRQLSQVLSKIDTDADKRGAI
ncbi:MAG TPA: glutamyl-tRNA reductase [Ruminococcaceae bacterium]|nr:glutamyl-tRNA reductase [Oscillospiraceae bacterium]